MLKSEMKIIALFSGIAAVFGVLTVLLFYLFDVGIFDLSYRFVSAISFIYSCLLLYYFYKAGAKQPFNIAMLRVMVLNFVFALVTALFIALLLSVNNQQFLDFSKELAVSSLEESKAAYLESITEIEYNERVAIVSETTVYSTVTDFFVKFLGVGFVYSLIVSVIFRSKK